MVVVCRTKGGSYILAEEDGTISQTRYTAFRIIRYHLWEGLSFKLKDFVERDQLRNLDRRLATEEGDEEKRIEEEGEEEGEENGGKVVDERTKEHGTPPPEPSNREAPLPLLPLPRLDDALPANIHPTHRFLGVSPPKLILKRVICEES